MPADAPKPFYYRHTSHDLISRVSLAARRQIFARFMDELRPSPQDEILDVGVTQDRTRPESNFFEALYPHPEKVRAASVEDASGIERDFPGVRFTRFRAGGPLPFEDDAFDAAFCNAVVEHVGGPAKQRDFVREIVRVSRRGLIATPYRYFPVEAHTVLPLAHWLPRRQHRAILRTLGFGELASEDRLHLLDRGEVRALFPDGVSVELFFTRVLGWPANVVAVYRKAA